jgi:hypothetical protein
MLNVIKCNEFRNTVLQNPSFEEILKLGLYKISYWKHIYLKLKELGRLESYVTSSLEKTSEKYQRVNSTP